MSGQSPYWRVAFRGHGQVPQGHRPDLVVHGEMAAARQFVYDRRADVLRCLFPRQ